MASGAGTTVIDFGSISIATSNFTSVAVTGQTGITSGSYVEAWIRLTSTAEHSADEHMVESLKITAGNIVVGTGFTIYAEITNGAGYGTYNVNWVWST